MHRLTVTTLALAVLLGFATDASAASEMQVFEGFASSRAVLAERYTDAIAIAEKRQRTEVAFFKIANATSLCVAHLKTGALELASTACEAAVDTANGLRSRGFLNFTTLSIDDVRDVVSANRQVVATVQLSLASAQE
ncbi:MAG: hypothetical protein AAGC71_17675 [Pseudomonadota bacterium]